MREILFRGKRVDNDEWVEGSLVHRTQFYGDPDDCYFILYDGEFDCDYYGSVEVDFKTVGQYTGLTDKNGKKVFEGDILTFEYGDLKKIGYVFYFDNGAKFGVKETGGYENLSILHAIHIREWNMKVIGNIHDNLELLKGGQADA